MIVMFSYGLPVYIRWLCFGLQCLYNAYVSQCVCVLLVKRTCGGKCVYLSWLCFGCMLATVCV